MAAIISGLGIIIGYKIINMYPFFWGIIQKILSLSLPFFYALIIAYVLNPIVKLFKNKFKIREGLAILITYAIVFGLVGVLLIYCIPGVLQSVVDLTADIPQYITEAQHWLNGLMKDKNIQEIINATGTMDSVHGLISQIGVMTMTLLESSVSYIFSISGYLVKFILGILISIYVLIDKERLIREVKRMLFVILKPSRATKTIELVRIFNNMIGTYIGIKAIDSSIIAGLAFILLTAVKSEYTLLLTLIVGISNMIPYFGPFVGEVVGFLFNVFISPTKGIVVFLVLLCLQLFDGWYLDPKLIGGKVGVRPLFIILGVVIGGGFFGPVGMLLASPTVATIKIYYDRKMKRNEELTKLADKA